MLKREQMHDYQRQTVQFAIDHPRCAVWLGLGGGKTVSTLTVVRDLLDSLEVNKVLVIAPLRVANTVWHPEIAKWEHLSPTQYSICTGSVKARVAALNKPAGVYVINRENVPWLVEYYGKKWPFDMVVIDEASSFKSHKTKRWKALRKVNKLINRLILLTGTPAPNGVTDLWAQFFLIDYGQRLGKSFTAFTSRWFESDYMGYNVTPRKGASDEIHKAVDDVTFSIDLPKQSERIDIVRHAELSPAQQKEYAKLEKEFLLEIGDADITAMNAASLSNKLLQYANGNLYDENRNVHRVHTAKLDVLKEIIEEAQGEPVLIAYNYKSDLSDLLAAFPGAEVMGKDLEQVERWNRREIPILFAHPASAGHGLNLQQGSSIMVWYGLTWSLEYYQQFIGRLDRQGQTQTVRNIHIVTKGTIDEGVMLALENKATTQGALLDYMRKKYS